MTASERSLLGLAKQTAKGTPNVTDNAFKYLLFSRGAAGPNSLVVPTDQEVGGGAMLRSVLKMGVTSGVGIEFVPRPDTLGTMLLGALGRVTSLTHSGGTLAYDHEFELPVDQFSAPYFTVRSSPGGLKGEQLQDCRVAALALNWRSPGFVRAALSMIGGLPTGVSMASWNGAAQVDDGPQFITPLSTIQLPTGAPAKVLAGSFAASMQIPLDEQWIVGSYSPDDFDIVQRAFILSLTLKISDAALYTRMMYDPASGNNWVAGLMREADILVEFKSNTLIEDATPYSVKIEANGSSGAGGNVVWTCSPIGMRAGSQITLNATGMFLADSVQPVKVTLVNDVAAY